MIRETACAIINFLLARFYSGGVIGHFTDGHQFSAGERPRECGTYLRPVADHPDVVVVSHSLLLGTLDNEVLQESINDVCHLIRFPSP